MKCGNKYEILIREEFLLDITELLWTGREQVKRIEKGLRAPLLGFAFN